MFFDDFGYYNLIVRSIFVVNIDWILVVLNWYLKVRCVLVINFCYMNKLLNIEFVWKIGILKFDNFLFWLRIYYFLYWCKEIELVFVIIIWKKKIKFN